MSRVCVFIDGSNLYFALKRNNKMTRVDYYQFSLALAGDRRKLVRTYYYNAVFDAAHFSEKAKSQQSFGGPPLPSRPRSPAASKSASRSAAHRLLAPRPGQERFTPL